MFGDLYFWRQVFILTTGLCYSISVGIMISFPSVLTPALVSSNSTDIHATSDQASWIAAINGIAGTFGFFILSPILQILGRKVVHMSCNLLLLIGWIIFPLANSITALFAARIIQGLAMGGIYIHGMIICEYVNSKRRGYFMTIKKASIATGTLICHSLSLFLDWRQISSFAIILPTVSIILTFFWPESPSYLAMKGRFEECEKSFLWLNGRSNLNELHHLVSMQKERIKNHKPEKQYKILLKKDFLKPLLVVSLLTLLLDIGGRFYFLVYIIQIMIELIGDKSMAIYFSLGADSLVVIALVSSCFFIDRFKRRYFLFSSCIITVILMMLVSLLMLLKSYNVEISVWYTPSIIILQTFVVNFGLVPVAFAITGETFPLEYKGIGSCISGIVFTLLYALTIKITPIMMENIGVGGTYFVYGLCIAVCTVLLYFIVPETKGKTLQQIEDEIKGIKTNKFAVETDALLLRINRGSQMT